MVWNVRLRSSRSRGHSWLVVGAVVLASLGPGSFGAASVAAKGDDVCPESNHSWQAACNLGTTHEILGFISSAEDNDAYRFDVRDYGATVKFTLAERPREYRLNVTDWNGEVIASGPDGVVEKKLDLPGSYFVFVDSRRGDFSDTEPYRLVFDLTYAAQPVPDVLYAAEYRGGPTDVFDNNGTNRVSTDTADWAIDEGRIMATLKESGTDDEPVGSDNFLWPTPPDPGPVVEDFSMVVDVRLVSGSAAGYAINFRCVDEDNYYTLAVSIYDQQITLGKLVNGELEDIVEWRDAPSVRTTGVNRTVIRVVKDDIRVNVNGKEALRTKDLSFLRGAVGYGITTWGEPATLTFDNVLVTTPMRR